MIRSRRFPVEPNPDSKEVRAASRVTVIVPVYNEAGNIPRLYDRLKKMAATLPDIEWGYVFVNDGSKDRCLETLKGLAAQDAQVRIIDFSRNFGKEAALTAGVYCANAEAAICIDADLQHPPEVIPEMIEKWRQGADIVIALRENTEKKPLLRQLGSWIFYHFMSRLSGLNMEPNSTDFRLLDGAVIAAFRQIPERHRLFRGIIDWMGFQKSYVKFKASARDSGMSSFSYHKLVEMALQALTSFSLFPLRLTGYLGALITLGSGFLLFYMGLARLGLAPGIFTPLAFVAVANTLLIGVVLMAIGLIALYIGTIHVEVIGRPLYIVRERVNFQETESEASA